ncbi:MAG: AAA family ATPase [Hyphomicrobiales bacterium]
MDTNTPGHTASESDLRPIPRISIQAFCETESLHQSIGTFAADRRIARAHVKTHMGGTRAAIEFYQSAPTPNVVIVESDLDSDALINELNLLANVCDADTKVIVIGNRNDVELYRRLMKFGVSEYLVAPLSTIDLISSLGDMFTAPDAEPLGRTIAFVGAKGGSGSSSIAQNTAWSISELFENDVIIADFDFAGGTVGLNFNQDPAQTIADALVSSEKLDGTYLDRILTKCTDHLNLLTAPAILDRMYEYTEEEIDGLVEVAQSSVPYFVMDLPYLWNDWMAATLTSADEVVITTTPDLAGLRNAKNLFDTLKQKRKTDPKPHIILNQVDRSKETEIKVGAFEDALETKVTLSIPFEPVVFGTAMNNGQMIAESNPRSPTVAKFKALAANLTGRTEAASMEKSGMKVPFLDKFRGKKQAS